MKRQDILDAAGKAVADRGLNYGQPEDNFERIARRWNVHLQNVGYGVVDLDGTGRRALTGADVAAMMVDVKLARLENDPAHTDSWIDIAGYAACGSECSEASRAKVENGDLVEVKPGEAFARYHRELAAATAQRLAHNADPTTRKGVYTK